MDVGPPATPSERNPAHEQLRTRLTKPPAIVCETRVLPADDRVERTPLAAEAITRYFAGPVHEDLLAGVGHCPHRERPDAVVGAITR